jgi:hypothetical protein
MRRFLILLAAGSAVLMILAIMSLVPRSQPQKMSSIAGETNNELGNFIPPEIQPQPSSMAVTYAGQLAKDAGEFQSIDLCITGATSVAEAQVETSRYMAEVKPIANVIPEPAITITLRTKPTLPTDVIDVYGTVLK